MLRDKQRGRPGSERPPATSSPATATDVDSVPSPHPSVDVHERTRASSRPSALPVNLDHIPADLRAIDRWVLWRYKYRAGQRKPWTKPPRRPDGGYADSTDPTTWSTFDTVQGAYRTGGFDGIGIVLDGTDDLVGVDLDHCVRDGEASGKTLEVVARLRSYTEVSPSGTGLRVILRGKLPAGWRKHGDVEVYAADRYLTITGYALLPDVGVEHRQEALEKFHAAHGPMAPSVAPTRQVCGPTLSDDEILDLIDRAANGGRFAALYRGDDGAYGGDTSAADLAFVSMLAFYTRDPVQLDRIYHGSGRARPKWDERRGEQTYGLLTISRALATVTEQYEPHTSREESEVGEESPPDPYVSSLDSLPSQAFTAWPVMDDRAYHGLVGDIVATIDPHSESDPNGLLLSALAQFGCHIGPTPHAMADASRHPARLNVALVGQTSRGRKGTAHNNVSAVLELVDPEFVRSRVFSGLGSGEGLVKAVSDGEADVRALVFEPEFARLLQVAQRKGSTLSAIVRDAWDRGRLQIVTRSNPLRVDDSHVVLLTHITVEELQRSLIETEALNGFANRFLFAMVRRSKRLPEGGGVAASQLRQLANSWTKRAVDCRQRAAPVSRTPEARELWAEIYHAIDDNVGGMLGAVTARAEPQMLRLQLIYALLDGSDRIDVVHVAAAKAVWDYCEASAAYIWGHSTGDKASDRLLVALKRAGASGLDTVAQHAVFSGHMAADRLDQIRTGLGGRGLVVTVTEQTRGRPRVVTYAAEHAPDREGSEERRRP